LHGLLTHRARTSDLHYITTRASFYEPDEPEIVEAESDGV
jgi:hypothetical protein